MRRTRHRAHSKKVHPVMKTKRKHRRKHGRKHTKKHHVKKTKNRKTRRSHKMRGGYGKGGCPLVGAPWNATGPANYYGLSKYGVSPGGTPPFPGDNSPSPQHGGSGGLFQQLGINPYRSTISGLGNVYNTYAGRSLTPSPYPQYQDELRPKIF